MEGMSAREQAVCRVLDEGRRSQAWAYSVQRNRAVGQDEAGEMDSTWGETD